MGSGAGRLGRRHARCCIFRRISQREPLRGKVAREPSGDAPLFAGGIEQIPPRLPSRGGRHRPRVRGTREACLSAGTGASVVRRNNFDRSPRFSVSATTSELLGSQTRRLCLNDKCSTICVGPRDFSPARQQFREAQAWARTRTPKRPPRRRKMTSSSSMRRALSRPRKMSRTTAWVSRRHRAHRRRPRDPRAPPTRCWMSRRRRVRPARRALGAGAAAGGIPCSPWCSACAVTRATDSSPSPRTCSRTRTRSQPAATPRCCAGRGPPAYRSCRRRAGGGVRRGHGTPHLRGRGRHVAAAPPPERARGDWVVAAIEALTLIQPLDVDARTNEPRWPVRAVRHVCAARGPRNDRDLRDDHERLDVPERAGHRRRGGGTSARPCTDRGAGVRGRGRRTRTKRPGRRRQLRDATVRRARAGTRE